MAATRTSRKPRSAVPAAPVEPIAPATVKTPRRRRPAAIPAKVVEVQGDALTSVAAPTLLGANGELIRHTQDYTVDLLDPGAEPDRDYKKVLAKDPSQVHVDFVAWVQKYVGYDADVKTVQILISTYHEFQKTPEQKAKTIAKRLGAAQKRAEAAKKTAAK